MLIDCLYRTWWGWRLENLCNRLKISPLVFQARGLKPFGYGYDPPGACPLLRAGVELEPWALLCPPDGLTDAWTLLGVPVPESPTFAFMQALEQGQPLAETAYIRRLVDGTLDQRWPYGARHLRFQRFRQLYAARRAQILAGTYPPVRVLRVAGKYYVLNGKHRAALCALLGERVRCDVLDPAAVYAATLRRVHKRLSRRPAQFQTTLRFLAAAKTEALCVGR